MSIIGIYVPARWTLKVVVKSFSKIIKGQFQALNFDPNYKKKNVQPELKICYLKLSERLYPQHVVDNLNGHHYKWGSVRAFIPRRVPDMHLGKNPKKKAMRLSRHDDSPQQVLVFAHQELMTELQSIYSGLYNLSSKLDHKLLETISVVIFKRLTDLLRRDKVPENSCFCLTKAYRKAHPHFADFQFILSNLHQVEDEMGKPRTQVTESDLTKVNTSPCSIGNVPYSDIVSSCNKYTQRITSALKEYLKNLECEINPNDSDEEIARKKVRSELVKMGPNMGQIFGQLLTKQLLPTQTPNCRMRMYGDPFLANKDMIKDFLHKYHPLKVHRSLRMYNLVLFSMSQFMYSKLMVMDGCEIGGSKLIIRLSDAPVYKIPESLRAEMEAFCGDSYDEGDDYMGLDSMNYEEMDTSWVDM